MAGKELIVDLSTVDLTQVFATTEEIRKYNPQRHEMEQLTAIIMVDEIRQQHGEGERCYFWC